MPVRTPNARLVNQYFSKLAMLTGAEVSNLNLLSSEEKADWEKLYDNFELLIGALEKKSS